MNNNYLSILFLTWWALEVKCEDESNAHPTGWERQRNIVEIVNNDLPPMQKRLLEKVEKEYKEDLAAVNPKVSVTAIFNDDSSQSKSEESTAKNVSSFLKQQSEGRDDIKTKGNVGVMDSLSFEDGNIANGITIPKEEEQDKSPHSKIVSLNNVNNGTNTTKDEFDNNRSLISTELFAVQNKKTEKHKVKLPSNKTRKRKKYVNHKEKHRNMLLKSNTQSSHGAGGDSIDKKTEECQFKNKTNFKSKSKIVRNVTVKKTKLNETLSKTIKKQLQEKTLKKSKIVYVSPDQLNIDQTEDNLVQKIKNDLTPLIKALIHEQRKTENPILWTPAFNTIVVNSSLKQKIEPVNTNQIQDEINNPEIKETHLVVESSTLLVNDNIFSIDNQEASKFSRTPQILQQILPQNEPNQILDEGPNIIENEDNYNRNNEMQGGVDLPSLPELAEVEPIDETTTQHTTTTRKVGKLHNFMGIIRKGLRDKIIKILGPD